MGSWALEVERPENFEYLDPFDSSSLEEAASSLLLENGLLSTGDAARTSPEAGASHEEAFHPKSYHTSPYCLQNRLHHSPWKEIKSLLWQERGYMQWNCRILMCATGTWRVENTYETGLQGFTGRKYSGDRGGFIDVLWFESLMFLQGHLILIQKCG